MSGLEITLQFLVALMLIGLSGTELARSGDVIAERTGLGGTRIGLFVLATVTSFPELITGVSAVSLANTPDIAVGAVLGSCVFNLLILVILDLAMGSAGLYANLKRNHLLPAGFGLLLIGVAALEILLEHSGRNVGLGWIGFSTPLLVVIYAAAVFAAHRLELASDGENGEEEGLEENSGGTGMLYVRFSIAALAVIVAGLWLPFVGTEMADVLGFSETFVGTLFIAFATSVPEVVVSIAAVRIGSPNMAVSNLLGSNLVNMLILVPEDLLVAGPILAAASQGNLLTAISAMLMTVIFVIALMMKARVGRFAAVNLLLVGIYLVNSYLAFRNHV